MLSLIACNKLSLSLLSVFSWARVQGPDPGVAGPYTVTVKGPDGRHIKVVLSFIFFSLHPHPLRIAARVLLVPYCVCGFFFTFSSLVLGKSVFRLSRRPRTLRKAVVAVVLLLVGYFRCLCVSVCVCSVFTVVSVCVSVFTVCVYASDRVLCFVFCYACLRSVFI